MRRASSKDFGVESERHSAANLHRSPFQMASIITFHESLAAGDIFSASNRSGGSSIAPEHSRSMTSRSAGGFLFSSIFLLWKTIYFRKYISGVCQFPQLFRHNLKRSAQRESRLKQDSSVFLNRKMPKYWKTTTQKQAEAIKRKTLSQHHFVWRCGERRITGNRYGGLVGPSAFRCE